MHWFIAEVNMKIIKDFLWIFIFMKAKFFFVDNIFYFSVGFSEPPGFYHPILLLLPVVGAILLLFISYFQLEICL